MSNRWRELDRRVHRCIPDLLFPVVPHVSFKTAADFRGSFRVPLRLNLRRTSSLLDSWPPSPALSQMLGALLHNPPSGNPATAAAIVAASTLSYL